MEARTLLGVLAGGACVIAGAGLAMMFEGDRNAQLVANSDRVAAPAPPRAEFVEPAEFRALVEEVRRLREELAAGREPVVGAAAAAAPRTLQGELTEMRELLRALRSRPAFHSDVELDLSSTGPHRAEVFVREYDPETDHDELLAKRYLLWTAQRVLDELGAPDRVRRQGGGMEWTYVREVDERGESLTASLEFSCGYVTGACFGLE